LARSLLDIGYGLARTVIKLNYLEIYCLIIL